MPLKSDLYSLAPCRLHMFLSPTCPISSGQSFGSKSSFSKTASLQWNLCCAYQSFFLSVSFLYLARNLSVETFFQSFPNLAFHFLLLLLSLLSLCVFFWSDSSFTSVSTSGKPCSVCALHFENHLSEPLLPSPPFFLPFPLPLPLGS